MQVVSRYKEQEFVEIIPNLWLGSLDTLDRLLKRKRIDTIVPLDSLYGDIWNNGIDYEILYYPTPDFSVLPYSKERQVVSAIVARLKENKKVALLCYGGIGRTGYIASLVIKEMGLGQHPLGVIGFLRENYNLRAVESFEQMERVVENEYYSYWATVIPEMEFYFATNPLLNGYK